MKRLISLLMILICVFTLWGCVDSYYPDYTQISNPGLNAHFIDVGQGDCTLLESDGEYALIDAGEYNMADRVIRYLKKMNVSSLKYVISTHPHSDHCGGLGDVIKEFDCDTFICPQVETDSIVWEYTLDAVDEGNLLYVNPNVGEEFDLGEATISVLSPSVDSVYSSMNDYSIVCKVSFEDTSMLLTGDAETVVEKELLRSDCNLEANVLKCGHHGSSTSTSHDFLKAVNPDCAIISCGKDNDYGHPHRETISALDTYSIPYYRTDELGTIVVSSDGEGISVTTDQTTQTVTENILLNEQENIGYTGNKNSKVFHRSTCSSVTTTKEKNKVYFDDRQSAIDSGYKPCKTCNP